MPEIVENLVIGGGPAGSALAIELARAGQTVTLLERKRQVHHKVCGEFISWEAAEYLRRLGLDLESLGAVEITRLRMISGDRLVESALPQRAWSLSRQRLDEALLKLAACHRTDLRYGTAARRLSRSSGRWSVELNGAPALEAHSAFVASGKHDLPHWRRPASQNDFIGLKMHMQLSRPAQCALQSTVEIFFFEGGYAGLEPVEDGYANLCFLIDKDVFLHCEKDWQRVLEWLAAQSPHLKHRLCAAQSQWPRPLAVSGIPYGYIHGPQADGENLYRLGDQMAVIPSFAGDGIAIALHSARLAARIRLSGGTAGDYHRQAFADAKGPVRKAQMLATLFASRRGRAASLRLAERFPQLVRGAITHTRIAAA